MGKYFIMLFLCVLSNLNLKAQLDEIKGDTNNKVLDNFYGNSDFLRYKISIVYEEFDKKLRNEKYNYKILREFVGEKQELYYALKSELSKHKYKEGSRHKNAIKYIESKLNKTQNPNKDSIFIPQEHLFCRTDSSPDSLGRNMSYYEAENYLEIVKQKLEPIERDNKFREYLHINIDLVSQDILKCRKQIEVVLYPEYKDQQFRTWISGIFALLIGILLIGFYKIVYDKSDFTISKELLGSKGLQFLTLFVLIIAVILFGIMDILKSSELSAILSGISGYILGKGVKENDIQKDNKVKDETTESIEIEKVETVLENTQTDDQNKNIM